MTGPLVENLVNALLALGGVGGALFVIFLLDRDRWRAQRRRRRRESTPAAPSAPAPLPRVEPAPRPSPQGRCPFCHDDVDARAAVVCALCLARHHELCWDEGGACGACRSTERHGRLEEKPPPGRERA